MPCPSRSSPALIAQAFAEEDPAARRALIRAALDELDTALAKAEPLGDDPAPQGFAALQRWRDWLHRTLQLHDA